MTTLGKEYSDGKVSIRTIKSSVINIVNMEMITKTRQVRNSNGYNCGTYRDQDPHHSRYVRDTRAVPKQPEKSIGYQAAMKNDFASIVRLIQGNNQRIKNKDEKIGRSDTCDATYVSDTQS